VAIHFLCAIDNKFEILQNSCNNKKHFAFEFPGMASLVLTVATGCLAFLTFWFPQKEKNQSYYLMKDLMISSCIYVIPPLIIVWNNPKMKKYYRHHFKNSRIVTCIEYSLCKFTKFKIRKSNQVVAVNVIKVRA